MNKSLPLYRITIERIRAPEVEKDRHVPEQPVDIKAYDAGKLPVRGAYMSDTMPRLSFDIESGSFSISVGTGPRD